MAGSGDPGGIAALSCLTVGLLETNCYVITSADGAACVVDPGGDAALIAARVAAQGGKLVWILCTHGHFDHVEAAGELKAACGGDIALHRGDLPLWRNIGAQTRTFGLPEPPFTCTWTPGASPPVPFNACQGMPWTSGELVRRPSAKAVAWCS